MTIYCASAIIVRDPISPIIVVFIAHFIAEKLGLLLTFVLQCAFTFVCVQILAQYFVVDCILAVI